NNLRRRNIILSPKWISILRIAARDPIETRVILLRLGPLLRFTRKIIRLTRGWFGPSMERRRASMLVGLVVAADFSAWASTRRGLFIRKISPGRNGLRRVTNSIRHCWLLLRPRSMP